MTPMLKLTVEAAKRMMPAKTKKVRVRMIVEYEITVPVDWDKATIEFNRNDGTWCADDAMDELKALSAAMGCLCPVTRFEAI